MRSIHSYLVNGVFRGFLRTALASGIDLVPWRDRIVELAHKAPRVRTPEVRVHDATLGSVPARWFVPDHNLREQVVLYLHGGAFLLPWMVVHEQFCAFLARRLGAAVVMPDYRLAPDYPFPAAPDDCLQAYRALLELGYPASDIAVAGDSAGGNLALVTLMSAREAGLPQPSCAVLLSPLTSFRFDGRSVRENNGKDPMFVAGATAQMADFYVPPGHNLGDYRLSPREHSFRGLPPLRFYAGSTELLRDDSSLAAARARSDGVEAIAHIGTGMPHVYPLFRYLPEARRAGREIVAFLAVNLAGGRKLPLAAVS